MCETCGCQNLAHEHNHEPENRIINMAKDVMEYNNAFAAENRKWFAEKKITALNLLSSPGAGKTTLLAATIKGLQNTLPSAVIEGDQETEIDAQRIRDTGVKVVQINTGKACHLDAHHVGHAAQELLLADGSLLFIENVGNLVCPAAFDLGEKKKIVILSATEGEEKPLKYPYMFAAADVMIISKIDMAEYTDFDFALCEGYARKINPDLRIFRVSAKTGEGMASWLDWLKQEGK